MLPLKFTLSFSLSVQFPPAALLYPELKDSPACGSFSAKFRESQTFPSQSLPILTIPIFFCSQFSLCFHSVSPEFSIFYHIQISTIFHQIFCSLPSPVSLLLLCFKQYCEFPWNIKSVSKLYFLGYLKKLLICLGLEFYMLHKSPLSTGRKGCPLFSACQDLQTYFFPHRLLNSLLQTSIATWNFTRT